MMAIAFLLFDANSGTGAISEHSVIGFATPQMAALSALYPLPGKAMIVKRINTAGDCAAVLIRGGMMEGGLVNDPILVRRYSFGWQALEALNFRCRLTGHNLGRGVETALMRGMPKMIDDRPCYIPATDSGDVADVESIRRVLGGPLRPLVIIAGDYAMGQWYGAGGGDTIYRRTKQSWRRIAGGGGGHNEADLRALGVPKSARCAFLSTRLSEPRCSKRK